MSDLGPDARALLEASDDFDHPKSSDDARMRRALVARLGVGIGLAASATATSTAAGAAGTTAGIVSAGAAGTGGAAVATAASAGIVVKALAAVAIVGGLAVGGGYVYHAHSVSLPPPAASAPTTSPVVAAPRPAPILDPPGAPAPPDPVATAAVPARTATAPASPPAPRVAPRPTASSMLDEEGRLLREANQAIGAHDGATALARLDEHARRFPYGMLAEERDAERVFALCELGKKSDARRAAAAFLADSPRSPLADRVRHACASD